VITPVERVLTLKSIDLLKDVPPRHLLALSQVAREVEMWSGQMLYEEEDPADAIYVVVAGRVKLTNAGVVSEVGASEAFGTWALVDDSARGQRAECMEDGTVLVLDRDQFYEVAAGDPTLLVELVWALAKRLRAIVAEQPAEARVEGEGVEPTVPDEVGLDQVRDVQPVASGKSLVAAVFDRPQEAEETASATDGPGRLTAGAHDREQPTAGGRDRKQPSDRAQDRKQPTERAQDRKQPTEGAQDRKEPSDRAQDQKQREAAEP
jgi:hypothetical protein